MWWFCVGLFGGMIWSARWKAKKKNILKAASITQFLQSSQSDLPKLSITSSTTRTAKSEEESNQSHLNKLMQNLQSKSICKLSGLWPQASSIAFAYLLLSKPMCGSALQNLGFRGHSVASAKCPPRQRPAAASTHCCLVSIVELCHCNLGNIVSIEASST